MRKTMSDYEATCLLNDFDDTGQLVMPCICINCAYDIIYTIIENRKDVRISLNYIGQGMFDLIILGRETEIE